MKELNLEFVTKSGIIPVRISSSGEVYAKLYSPLKKEFKSWLPIRVDLFTLMHTEHWELVAGTPKWKIKKLNDLLLIKKL